MKIEKDSMGWRIEASTSDEEAAFEAILDYLREKYCITEESRDSSLAMNSRPLDHAPAKVPSDQ